jgi:PAS domain S-box-containing protein
MGMKVTKVKVLLIEDDEDDVLLTKEYLAEVSTFSFEVSWESDLDKARNKMLEGDYDIFLIDYHLGSENGLDLVKFIQGKGVLTPAIILTGQGDLKVDIDASSFGASDYLVKSELNASGLERSIRYSLSQSKIIRELDEKEKKYRSLFERSIDPIFLASDKLVLMDVNNSFLKFAGYSTLESKSITIDTIFAKEEDYHYFRSTLKEEEQIKDFEVLLLTKSGEKKACLLNCVFIPDQASEFCCCRAPFPNGQNCQNHSTRSAQPAH